MQNKPKILSELSVTRVIIFMIRNISSKKRFYLVSASDWQTVIHCETKEEAAVRGFRKAYANYKDNLNLSTVICVCDLSDLETTTEHDLEIFYAPTVILDAGFPKLSRNLEMLIKKNTEK